MRCSTLSKNPPCAEGATADIFIAYARSDKARVQSIVNALREAGFIVFIDVDITPGLKWAKVIEQQLDDAHCVLVIWSKQSVDRDYVIEEASRGRERQVLLPVMIDTVKLPLGFASYQASDLVAWDGLVDHPSWQQVLVRADEIVSKSTGQLPRLPSKPRQTSKSPPAPQPEPTTPLPIRTALRDRRSRPIEDAVRRIGRLLFFRVVEPNPDVAIEPSPDLFFDQREQVFEDIYSNPPLEWIQGDLTSWYGDYRLATKLQIREQFRFDEPLFQFMDIVERVRFSNFSQITLFLSLISVLFSGFTKVLLEWIGRVGGLALPDSKLFIVDGLVNLMTIHLLAVLGFTLACTVLFVLFRTAQEYTERALNAVLFAKIARIQDSFKTAIHRIDEEGQEREQTTQAGRDWAERSRWWTILAMWYARRLEGLTRYLAAVNFPSESQARLGLLAGVAVSVVSALVSLFILFDGRFTPDLLTSNTGLVRIGATLSVVVIAYLFLRRAQISFRRLPLDNRLVREFRGLVQYEEIASIVYRDKIRIVTERDSIRRH